MKKITELKTIICIQNEAIDTLRSDLEATRRAFDELKSDHEVMKNDFINELKACNEHISHLETKTTRTQESVNRLHKRWSFKKFQRRLRSDDFWKESLHSFLVAVKMLPSPQ